MKKCIGVLWFAALCACLTACNSSGRSDLQQVTGKVTYKGQPLAGATVNFAPLDAPSPAVGVTDEQGEYILNTGAQAGAAPGKYRVGILKFAAGNAAAMTSEDMARMAQTGQQPEQKSEIPTRYNAPPTSGFDATVTAGAENVFNFDLVD